MKQRIFSNWNFFRFFRLVLGIAIIAQASFAKDILFILLGLGFTILPVLNIGCCGSNTCYNPPKKISKKSKDIVYEEVV